ncbi:TPA: hypothetical protein N0F65_001205 [Lagenidium giganteum]|uniref:Uncharacterized protein n=1 Tax=Lagenidium giganteum TaxID=4803 RepID=A0AAV2Z5T2_9STRA|nr:TPA: hypothetical protein N0F65_001205 [Lagenidium giganteum]
MRPSVGTITSIQRLTQPLNVVLVY